jgi:hypothetical protein
MFFYHHLCARGYPRKYLAAVFGEVTWDQRSQILNHTTKKKEGDSFFETYLACALTLRNALEWPLVKERLDLRLTELIQSTYGDFFSSQSLPSPIQRPQTWIDNQEMNIDPCFRPA